MSSTLNTGASAEREALEEKQNKKASFGQRMAKARAAKKAAANTEQPETEKTTPDQE